MVILGICGPIGHGKSTLADFFASLEPNSIHLESSVLISEVADKLNSFYESSNPRVNDLPSINAWLSNLAPILSKVTHYKLSETIVLSQADVSNNPDIYQKLWDYLKACESDPSIPTHKITSINKSQYRSLLQWLGAYGEQHISSGLWYRELLRRAKASKARLVIIGGVRFMADAELIHRAGGLVISISRPDKGETDPNDATEQFRKYIPVDIELNNDGTLAQLQKTATQILSDIKSDTLSHSYVASRQ